MKNTESNQVVNLSDYDLIIINTSGGKDSIAAIWKILVMCRYYSFPKEKVILSHQDLGEAEWPDSHVIVESQASYFGLRLEKVKRVDHTGYEESLLEYVERRGMWPSPSQRWCTSDYKRSQGAKVLRRLSKETGANKILYVFGFRREESPFRAKKDTLILNRTLSTKKRVVHEFNPILEWSESKVWEIIKKYNIPYPKAYDHGMPRYSCVLCIMANREALTIAGYHNPELLDKYIAMEEKTGHTFRHKFSLKEVRQDILDGKIPNKVPNWRM